MIYNFNFRFNMDNLTQSQLSENSEELIDEVFVDSPEKERTSENLDLTEPAHSFSRYFLFRKGDKNSKCRICNKTISRKDGNTTGMEKHLKLHKRIYNSFLDAKVKKSIKRPANEDQSTSKRQLKQMNLNEYKSVEKWPNNNPRSEKIDSLILRFICLSCEPLQLTEKNGFSDIFAEACPSYKLKCRQFMTKLMESKYEEKFSVLKNAIKDAKHISLTTDLWQNRNKKKGFLSLTCHYIDDTFQRIWKVLKTEPFQEAHTALNIQACISDIMEQYEIQPERVHMILRDAASSMVSAVEDLNFDHFNCFCHKINLALNDGLEHKTKCVLEIKTQIQLSRELVAFYNRSKNFQNLLTTQQELIGAPKNGLIQDIVTRWNSTLFMIERIVQQQRPLTLAQIDFSDLELPEFDLLKNLVEILSPFDMFTKQLSNRNESISSVLPTYRCLLSVLNEKDSDTQIIRSFKKVVGNGLKTRMDKYQNKRCLIIATLIDPRYKNHPNIFGYADRIQNKALLQSEIELFLNPERRFSDSDSNLDLPNSNDLMSTFLFTNVTQDEEQRIGRNNSQDARVDEEIELFFKSATEKSSSDPLEFWRNCNIYPHIKQIVPKFLCPPPSSVESERTFSKLSEIYSAKRSNLSEIHAMQQLFLHFNFDD